MVTVTYDGRGSLRITGHAGQGPAGHDLVCAAVSALTETLALGFTDVVPGGIRCRVETGRAEFRWEHLTTAQQAVLDTIVTGLRDLAASHGSFVRFVEPTARR